MGPFADVIVNIVSDWYAQRSWDAVELHWKPVPWAHHIYRSLSRRDYQLLLVVVFGGSVPYVQGFLRGDPLMSTSPICGRDHKPQNASLCLDQ
jgi:hypothetical protein